MLFIFICIAIWCIAKDWEDAEKAKERRHRELMEKMEQDINLNVSGKIDLDMNSNYRKTTRIIKKDTNGNITASEILEDSYRQSDTEVVDLDDDYEVVDLDEDYEDE